MQGRTCGLCLALAITLCASGTAFAQRRSGGAGRHGGAVSRGSAVVRSHPVGPAVVGGHYYRYTPYYRPHYGAAIGLGVGVGLGLYLGYPYYYGYYGYPYSYGYAYPPVYAYPDADPYPYAYADPYASTAPYPYDGSTVTTPEQMAPPASAPIAPTQPNQGSRGQVAIVGAPAGATVYVDDNYAGPAADFGSAQPLSEPAGYHRIEIRSPGHRAVVVHIDVQPNRTVTYQYPNDAS
jgi:PEGA domain